MSRIIKGYEGSDERGLYREIEEYDVECEICNKSLSLEDDVFNFGRGFCCLECLINEYKVGTVDDLLERGEI